MSAYRRRAEIPPDKDIGVSASRRYPPDPDIDVSAPHRYPRRPGYRRIVAAPISPQTRISAYRRRADIPPDPISAYRRRTPQTRISAYRRRTDIPPGPDIGVSAPHRYPPRPDIGVSAYRRSSEKTRHATTLSNWTEQWKHWSP